MAALRHENFVDGAWLTGSSNEFQSENPANGEIIWSGNAADSNDVLVAISAAKK
ncbi:MAG: N-succinylglutamate 5-semialdehyde dehydrogenase, partial [Gammaproteobacteria bacterium]|nr:N-succinylglutamate 5-semialdehyde dehydrogenase [Gammaproteobacteria bacterium]